MKNRLLMIIALLLLFSFVAYGAAGDSDDPLITLSYLEERLAELKQEYTEANRTSGKSKTVNAVFQPLTFEAGTIVSLGESTEFIVRAGEAILVDPKSNNMPDLTAGQDIKAGEILPLNHHMVNPRADGRGFLVLTGNQFWVMIKGDYELQ